MRVSKLSGVLAGVMVLAMGVTVAAQRSEPGSTTRQPSQTQAQQQRQAQPRSGSEQARNEVCPADIQHLRVQTAHTEQGGALVFTTNEANSRELRQRLTRFIQVHDQAMQQHQGSQQGMQQPGSQGMQQPGSQAQQQQHQQQQRQAGATGSQHQRRFADMQALIHQGRAEMIEIPNGAILLFSMDNRDRVSDLQNELRQDAQALQQGRCPLSLQLERA